MTWCWTPPPDTANSGGTDAPFRRCFSLSKASFRQVEGPFDASKSPLIQREREPLTVPFHAILPS
ncbi:hypothetical protein HMPREF0372_00874 [Flavonifractor plautii ATCC 29863]|uniref:Uncharacterized protein n=1 Tax=Flavonifractor plautii ATCC 29863 TaxID=411475 RepID=G9YN02_FLAPL|nr:hypothetical protein HMPREF0372_00874 [Flavonifractor plautii ATCC 29863]